MELQNVFDYEDYKTYLRDRFETSGKTRGLRTRLAEMLHCKNAFISKVLSGEFHFSLEASLQISEFLGHTTEEQDYFLLLVQHARAGSKALELHFERKLKAIRERRQLVRSRIKAGRALNEREQSIYYSSWLYAAIHTLASIPTLQTREALARHLAVPLEEIDLCLEFLIEAGVLVQKSGRLQIGSAQIHLGRNSPMIKSHHSNWRVRAIQALDQRSQTALHYSSVISLSQADWARVRELLLKSIQGVDEITGPSREEVALAFSLDLFRI